MIRIRNPVGFDLVHMEPLHIAVLFSGLPLIWHDRLLIGLRANVIVLTEPRALCVSPRLGPGRVQIKAADLRITRGVRVLISPQNIARGFASGTPCLGRWHA